MWVFMSDAFISIVAHRTKPDVLLARARRSGDLKRAFPWVKEKRTPAADYLYRAEISRSHLSAHLESLVHTIDYDNFKGSVRDPARHKAYLEVWTSMKRYQGHVRPRQARRR